jgi:hypothetical protein
VTDSPQTVLRDLTLDQKGEWRVRQSVVPLPRDGTG